MKLSQFKFKLPEDQIALEPPHRVFENEDGSVECLRRMLTAMIPQTS